MKTSINETWIVSPVNSNLVIGNDDNECKCLVMSGKWNGIAFTDDRKKKQEYAKLISQAPANSVFLDGLKERMNDEAGITSLGKIIQQNYKELYDYLIS